tara:strand:+ start:2027 stop:2224 length:198 start_codon:yes stop_codon:yes gene_type:complete
MKPMLFQPSERSILQSGLNNMTNALTANQKLLEIMEDKLAASELRFEELMKANERLEEKLFINRT